MTTEPIRGIRFAHVTGWDVVVGRKDTFDFAGVTTGDTEPVILYPDEGGQTHLRALYEAIGCNVVERVVLDRSGAAADLWVDEEALLKDDVAPNRFWSFFDGRDLVMNWYKIYGHVVAVGVDHATGILRTPTAEEINAVMTLASPLGRGPRDLRAVRRWLVEGVPWDGVAPIVAGPRPAPPSTDPPLPIEPYVIPFKKETP